MKTKRKKQIGGIRIKGFFRAQIVDTVTGKVVGDSGWTPNQITNYGLNSCFLPAAFGVTDSVVAAGLILGSGTNPASNTASLPGSFTNQYSTFGAAINASTQVALTQTFAGSNFATTATFQNIGILAASTGSLLAGKTISASSTVGTNQNINVTYNLNYTTS